MLSMMSYDVGGVTGYGQNIDRPNMKQGEITEAAQIDLPEYYCRANDAKSKPGTAMFSKQVGPVHMRVHVGDLMWTSSRTLGMGKCDSAVRQSGGASASFHVPVLSMWNGLPIMTNREAAEALQFAGVSRANIDFIKALQTGEDILQLAISVAGKETVRNNGTCTFKHGDRVAWCVPSVNPSDRGDGQMSMLSTGINPGIIHPVLTRVDANFLLNAVRDDVVEQAAKAKIVTFDQLFTTPPIDVTDTYAKGAARGLFMALSVDKRSDAGRSVPYLLSFLRLVASYLYEKYQCVVVDTTRALQLVFQPNFAELLGGGPRTEGTSRRVSLFQGTSIERVVTEAFGNANVRESLAYVMESIEYAHSRIIGRSEGTSEPGHPLYLILAL